jgi:hypothetical protein
VAALIEPVQQQTRHDAQDLASSDREIALALVRHPTLAAVINSKWPQ